MRSQAEPGTEMSLRSSSLSIVLSRIEFFMLFLDSLRERQCQPEVMDDPTLDPAFHAQSSALSGPN